MSRRIYRVDVDFADPTGKPSYAGGTYLIDATSPGQARAYVAGKFITCAIAKPREIVGMMSEGVKVETAGDQS